MLFLLGIQEFLGLAYTKHQIGLFVGQERIAWCGSIGLENFRALALLFQKRAVLLVEEQRLRVASNGAPRFTNRAPAFSLHRAVGFEADLLYLKICDVNSASLLAVSIFILSCTARDKLSPLAKCEKCDSRTIV